MRRSPSAADARPSCTRRSPVTVEAPRRSSPWSRQFATSTLDRGVARAVERAVLDLLEAAPLLDGLPRPARELVLEVEGIGKLERDRVEPVSQLAELHAGRVPRPEGVDVPGDEDAGVGGRCGRHPDHERDGGGPGARRKRRQQRGGHEHPHKTQLRSPDHRHLRTPRIRLRAGARNRGAGWRARGRAHVRALDARRDSSILARKTSGTARTWRCGLAAIRSFPTRLPREDSRSGRCSLRGGPCGTTAQSRCR